MACSISVGPPVGQAPNGILNRLTVAGTAQDCDTVRVTVTQTEPTLVVTPSRTASVTNGQWTVDFSISNGDFQAADFRCGNDNKWHIDVRCVNDENCQEGEGGTLITCGDCPQVTIQSVPGVDCKGGRRSVAFTAEVVTAVDATYSWKFGVDQDGQPGEDGQPGDGDGWLPPPDAGGVRTVTAERLYDTEDQPVPVTVRLITSTGPGSFCEATQTFILEPCVCELAVDIDLIDDPRTSSTDCLPVGDYLAAVSTTPSDPDTSFTWSVNGTSDSSQTGATFPFSLADGEQKIVSVAAQQGTCLATNALPELRACEDCAGFNAQSTVVDAQGRDVTDSDCLPPGSYTIELAPLSGGPVTYEWRRDNVVDDTVDGDRYRVDIENVDTVITVTARRGDCRDVTSVVLRPCRPPEEDVKLTCLVFKILALIGLGLATLGAILILCPAVTAPLLAPDAAIQVGIGLLVAGLLLLIIGLILWLLICKPSGCDWMILFWQALILVGLIMIYAGFCPACSWLLFGFLPLAAGVGVLLYWQSTCEPTRCRVIVELISLMTFAVNVVAAMEVVLAWCVISSEPFPAAVWGGIIAAVQLGLWSEANRAGCIVV